MQTKTNRLHCLQPMLESSMTSDHHTNELSKPREVLFFYFVLFFKMNLKFGKNKGISKNKNKATLAHFSSCAKVFQLLPCLIC